MKVKHYPRLIFVLAFILADIVMLSHSAGALEFQMSKAVHTSALQLGEKYPVSTVALSSFSLPPEKGNKRPKAHAGKSHKLTDENDDGKEVVKLDGSKSKDKDGRIISYSWKVEGSNTEIASGEQTVVDLPVGHTNIVLTVEDNDGLTDSDKIKITINEKKGKGKDKGGDDDREDEEDEEEEKEEDDDDREEREDHNDEEEGDGRHENDDDWNNHENDDEEEEENDEEEDDREEEEEHKPKNKAPEAHAGKAHKLKDRDNNGQELVKLDASGSKDKDGYIVAYSWKVEGADKELASGKKARVDLPIGHTNIVLTVTDNGGLSASDKVEVRIAAGDKDHERGEEDDDDDNRDEEEEEEEKDDDRDDEEEEENEEEKEGDSNDEDEEDHQEEEKPVNKAPEAHAGSNQELTDDDRDGDEKVKLDGSKSKDKDGEIISYSWHLEGAEIASGETATVDLPVGAHNVALTVTDNGGLTASSEVKIVVKEGRKPEKEEKPKEEKPKEEEPKNKAPEAHAGKKQELTDTDRNGIETITLDASQSKDKDGEIISYSWSIEGTASELATGVKPTVELGMGKTVIILTVTDNGGLSATDKVEIHIKEGAVEEGNSEEDNKGGEVADGGSNEGEEGGQNGGVDENSDDEAAEEEVVEEENEVVEEVIEEEENEVVEEEEEVIEEEENEVVEEEEEVTEEEENEIVEEGGEGKEEVGTAFLPNLFSPNGDQMNDFFILQGTRIGKVHLRIYNRQGRLIYETADLAEATQTGWDGNAFGVAQPEGSYVWILEANYTDGTPVLINGKIKGSITLIR